MSEQAARWRYVAQHADGRTLSGEVEAVSEAAAAARLSGEGLTPVRLTARRGPALEKDRKSVV